MSYWILNVLMRLVDFYALLIVVWAVFSWFPQPKGILKDIYRVLDQLVSPFINLFKRFIPPIGGIDFSPLIAIVALQVVARIVAQALIQIL